MLSYYLECLQQDWVLCVCYLVQGALLTLPDVGLRIFLSENLLFSPSEVQLIYAFMLLPWLCKPLYGFISDTFPIFGFRRFPYLLFSFISTAVFWFLLSFVCYETTSYDDLDDDSLNMDDVITNTYNDNTELGISLSFARILGLIGLYGESLCISIAGVVVDSVIVERVQKREVGKELLGQLQSVCTIWRLAGTLIASLGSGFFVDEFSVTFVFILTACLPLFSSCCVLFLHEERVSSNLRLKSQIENEIELDNLVDNIEKNDDNVIIDDENESIFKHFINQLKLLWNHLFKETMLWKPALFILVLSSTPSAYTAFYYFMYYEVGISATEFGVMMFITTLASLLGTLIYTVFLRKKNIRVVFALTIIIAFFIRLTPEILVTGLNSYLGIPGDIFAISDSAVISVVSQISLMPLIVLGAAVCPKGIEGTLYAFLMSLTEIGGIIGDLLSTLLTSSLGVDDSNFANLWILILICNIWSLIPISLLFLVPKNLNNYSIDNDDNIKKIEEVEEEEEEDNELEIV